MQLRDDVPSIFYPGHWGCFGGGIERDETPAAALCRELSEELDVGLEIGELRYFTHFSFDMQPLGYGTVGRTYYEARLTAQQASRLRLGEGAEVRTFEGEQLLAGYRVTPYDAFALWLHLRRER